MYLERIKPYEYQLLCGVVFRSHTPSVADRETGRHFFPCLRCKVCHEHTDKEILTLRLLPASRRDMEQATRIDKAVLKDRIVQALRTDWSELTYNAVAEAYGVSYSTVYRVASELGVADYDEQRETL